MKTQQYNNHVRYYAPHHFIFYPVIAILVFICIRSAWLDTTNLGLWLMMALLVLLVGWLSWMMRQHYALTCQDRMVRLELRLRYYQLTQQRLESIEDGLSIEQLAALRFASDDELVELIQRALAEKLSPTDIKQAIKHWLPDSMRV